MKIPFVQEDKKNEQVIEIPINKIRKNPYQPRTNFKSEEIIELAESIKNYGVIQPIIIRNNGENYDLIAGERRLRACQRLELKKIPAVIRKITEKEMAEIALIENLQRKDLNYFEEAVAYQKLIETFDMTQRELAEQIGKSQSTIANKLRLLKLDKEVCCQLGSELITERHARALLKLNSVKEQLRVIKMIKEKDLTVKETEKKVESILTEKNTDSNSKVLTVYKDLRLFTNTLNKTIKEMKTAGLDVKVEKEEKEEFLKFTIRLPKQPNKKG